MTTGNKDDGLIYDLAEEELEVIAASLREYSVSYPSDRVIEATLEKLRQYVPKPESGRVRLLKSTQMKVAVAAAAVLILVSTAVAWVGPARVRAGVLKILSLVPGIGPVEREELRHTLIKSDRIRIDYGGGFIEVIGLVAQPNKTSVRLYLDQVPGFQVIPLYEEEGVVRMVDRVGARFKEIYLLDPKGREYRYLDEAGFYASHSPTLSHSFDGGWTWHSEVYLELPPLDENTGLVTLVVPLFDGSEIRVDIPLTSLEEIGQWQAVTVTRRGITVSAAADFGTETRIIFEVIPPDPSAELYGFGPIFRSTGRGASPRVKRESLTGKSGRFYSPIRGYSRWEPNYWESIFEGIHPDEREVTLIIPAILLSERGEDRATVPVPEKGSVIELNQDINLGRFSLTLIRAEVVTYPHGDYLRVSVDLGPPGEETLVEFTFQRAYGVSEVDLSTGQMKSFDLPLEGNERSFDLTFYQPIYAVEGPWTFTFPVK